MLSLGQDGRWRTAMVAGLRLPAGASVLDVASGTGSITRLLQQTGGEVVAVDQSVEMMSNADLGDAAAVMATAEALPFRDGSFDALTFGYLLRYVDDVPRCMRELVRVVKPSGRVGMVEFGLPKGAWAMLWRVYTRLALPIAGTFIGSGWKRVGRFLGPSISEFSRRQPIEILMENWQKAGLVDVRAESLSGGGGLIMWGRKP